MGNSLRRVVSWSPVLVFVFVCFFSYSHAHKKKTVVFEELKNRFEELTIQKKEAQRIQDDLHLQIESQSDPLWIEQTLMRGLGLVPNGQKKIIFRDWDQE